MAVPKKKISYSRTRKRFLSKKEKFTLYTQCNSCSNFIKLHRHCLVCNLKEVSSQIIQQKSNFNTNIENVYYKIDSIL